MSDLYNTRIKLKRDTEANWLSADPVLLDGEVAVVYTANGGTRKKTGDGAKKFSELPYDDRKNWLQNDSSAADYIEHRPGGYMTDPIITDADAFTITAAGVDDDVYTTIVDVESSSITLSDYVIGDGVIVDFAGKSYNLQWYAYEGYPACGADLSESYDWSAAPFCIIAFFEANRLQAYYIYLQNAVTSPISVQIKKAKQTPVKIPLKYLESDLYIVKVTALSNEQRPGVDGAERSYDAVVSATYDDIVAAVGDGKTPILLGDVTALNLVEISTDTVDGAEPYMLFGGAYFDNDNRLYGTVVQINSDGTAVLKKYEGQFVRRFKDIEEANVRSVGKVLIGTKDTDGYKWAAGDAVTSDSIAGALGYTPVDQKTLDDLQKQIGNLDNLTTEAKANLVAAISEAAESGGNGLPTPAADNSDDGKTMVVNGSSWEMKKQANKTAHYVTFAADKPDDPLLEAVGQTAYDEIKGYLDAGDTVIAELKGTVFKGTADESTGTLGFAVFDGVKYSTGDDYAYYGFLYCLPTEVAHVFFGSNEPIGFSVGIGGTEENVSYLIGNINSGGLEYAEHVVGGAIPIAVNREGVLIWDYKEGITVPEATAANNGKIPQIVDGKWALANPPKLPDVSADDDGKLLGVTGGTWGKVDKPAALKNPNALTIKIGGSTVTYDGSVAQSIEIEDGSEVSY